MDLYLAALNAAGLPDDQTFREAVREHIEFGSQVAMHNSHAERDEDFYPLHEAPRWRWARDEPDDQYSAAACAALHDGVYSDVGAWQG